MLALLSSQSSLSHFNRHPLIRPSKKKQRSCTCNHALNSSQAKDYYQVLGVPVDATHAEIRKAYRQLQKKYHPDIAGSKGHAMTLLLNEAYETLMREDLRVFYDTSYPRKAAADRSGSSSFTGIAYSTWNGADRPQGIFVDENACIGCRECVFSASKTFTMDEFSGLARVTTQWGDPDAQIKIAVESCPVNCIHFVDRGDLPIFEYLMRPQLKPGCGVCGGGWERPSNVFMAAKTFKRKLESGPSSNRHDLGREETPAQRKARMEADFKLRAGWFWWLWSWGAPPENEQTACDKQKSSEGNPGHWPWKGLFGRSCTSELLCMPVDNVQAPKIIGLVREWAVTFASSSELPLPMPFKTEFIPNGVQLNLITMRNDIVQCVGSLVVTVEQTAIEDTFSNPLAAEKWFLYIKRHGSSGTKPLPGEKRIVQQLKDAISQPAGAYAMYNLPRKP